MRGTIRESLIVIVAALATAVEVHAAGPETNHVTTVVRHYDKKVFFTENGVTKTYPLETIGNETFRLGQNDAMSVSVEQTNPLLFKYVIKEGPATPNPSYAAALEFTGILRTALGLLPSGDALHRAGGPPGPDDILAAAGFHAEFVRRYSENIEKIGKAVASVPLLVKKSGLTWSDALAVQAEAASWNTILTTTEADLAVIPKAEKALYEFDIKAVAPLANTTPNPVVNPPAVNPPAANPPAANPPTIVNVDAQVTEEAIGGTGAGPTGGASGSLVRVLEYLKDHDEDVRTAIAALRQFQKATEGIGVPISKEGLRASPKEDRLEILTISRTDEGEKVGAAAKPPIGEYKINIKADTSVEYSFQPGVVYSLVEREDWDTKATADGKYEIVRADAKNEINGMTVAGVLSISPRSLIDWSFRPSFQVGLSPVQDRFGLFGGVSFRVFDLFDIGGGVAYQQTERLSSLQHAGDLLVSPDDLAVEIEPDTGFYFSITVDLGKK